MGPVQKQNIYDRLCTLTYNLIIEYKRGISAETDFMIMALKHGKLPYNFFGDYGIIKTVFQSIIVELVLVKMCVVSFIKVHCI